MKFVHIYTFLFIALLGLGKTSLQAQEDITLEYNKVLTQAFNGKETLYFQFEGKAGDVVSVQAVEGECCGYVEEIRLNDSNGREIGIVGKHLGDPFVIADLVDDGIYYVSVSAGRNDEKLDYLILVAETGYLNEDNPMQFVHDAATFKGLFFINPPQAGKYTISYEVLTEIAPDLTIIESNRYNDYLFNANLIAPYTSGTVTLELERFGMYIGVVNEFGRSAGVGEMKVQLKPAE